MTRISIGFAVLLACAPTLAQTQPPPAESAQAVPTRPPAPAWPPPPVTQYPWYPPPPPGAQYPWYPPPPGAQYPWYPPPPPPLPQANPTSPKETEMPTVAAQDVVAPSASSSPSRASWSLQLESAQGVATGKFQNTLLASHVDYAFASRLALGGYLALANMKGKDRRVNALMPCALVTYEKPPGPGHSVSFPLQFATGYLTRNGPVARLAAGLAWAIGKRTDLAFDLATMAWVTRDDMLLSADVAVELRFRAD